MTTASGRQGLAVVEGCVCAGCGLIRVIFSSVCVVSAPPLHPVGTQTFLKQQKNSSC